MCESKSGYALDSIAYVVYQPEVPPHRNLGLEVGQTSIHYFGLNLPEDNFF